jgi:hypothetical protein
MVSSTTSSRRVSIAKFSSNRRTNGPIDVAQIHIVAEGCAPGLTARIDDQHELRLRIRPLREGRHADLLPETHGRQHGAFGEDLWVWSYAHLEVLRPDATPLKFLFRRGSLVAARFEREEIGADRPCHGLPNLLGAAGVSAGLLFDQALDQAGCEGDSARLDHLKVDGRKQPGLPVVVLREKRLLEHSLDRPGRCGRGVAHQSDRVGSIEKLRNGRDERRQIRQDATVKADHAGPVADRVEHATDECRLRVGEMPGCQGVEVRGSHRTATSD